MKNQFKRFKINPIMVIKRALLLIACGSYLSINAQMLVPSGNPEYTFSGLLNGFPTCHSVEGLTIGGTACDVYLSGWDGTVEWRLTIPGAPFITICQGIEIIPGAINVNVGLHYDTQTQNYLVVVAYYLIGTGHQYRTYTIDCGASMLVLQSTTVLSTLAGATRISMDSHITYAIAIVWEDLGMGGIRVVTGLNGLFVAPVTLLNGVGKQTPDVAFCHAGDLDLHFVYLRSNDIYETKVNFFTVQSSGGGTVLDNIQDINTVTSSGSLPLIPSIDCPDHLGHENWAYTYAPGASDVHVRSSSSGVITTAVLTDGSLSNVAKYSKEIRPRIAYNHSGLSYHVCWYSSFNNGIDGDCYFTIEVDETSSSILSAFDYHLVANNSAFPSDVGMGLCAFGKHSDNPNNLFMVFRSDGFVRHKYHAWANTANFRAGEQVKSANTLRKEKCESAHVKEISLGVKGDAEFLGILKLGPNPFSKSTGIDIWSDESEDGTSIIVKDMQGRLLFTFDNVKNNINKSNLKEASKNLEPGVYIITVNTDNKKVSKNYKVLCTD